jgi:hypothetical protein
MERTVKASENKKFDQFISKLSSNEILDIQAMGHVKGGLSDGEGDGGSSVIIIPKK